MKLTEITDQIQAMGFNIVAMTYDPVEFLKTVEEDRDVRFPMLHDDNVSYINALGIRNLDYQPGQRAYGIPYPGIFLLDADGVIRYKFAEEDYRVRPDFADVLEALANMQ